MKNKKLYLPLLKSIGAQVVLKEEPIQSLWSGYGLLSRLWLEGAKHRSVIVKNIEFSSTQNHPRGWNTKHSHLRKMKSYQVELEWYKNWSNQCNEFCRVPSCHGMEATKDHMCLILEDLDESGFPLRKTALTLQELKIVLRWLANFHARFMNQKPEGLWEEGSYWHLSTRPDEWNKMEEGWLKTNAQKIANRLNDCQFQTLIHGDAKVANFCFSNDMQRVAAVDFQYIGSGCGMKDVAYLMSSCLNHEECEQYEQELLNSYFLALKMALTREESSLNFSSLEKEWREMYVFAWADFIRFLLGWMPTHPKINPYSIKMVERSHSFN